MSPQEARTRFYARCFAELTLHVEREEQRTQALTERLALIEDDIEKIHGMFAKINCAPTVPPAEDFRVQVVAPAWTATPYQLTGSD